MICYNEFESSNCDNNSKHVLRTMYFKATLEEREQIHPFYLASMHIPESRGCIRHLYLNIIYITIAE